VAVRIRMKKMGRTHRPYYRICAIDGRNPRDGKTLEELGTYDTSIRDTDARTTLDHERLSYWLSVGAQPSDKVAVLIKKYGPEGTHLEQWKTAREKLSLPNVVPEAPKAVLTLEDIKKPEEEPAAEAEAEASEDAEAPAEEAPAEEAASEETAE
jgi:small subunit ribosomal protein S16